MSLIEFLNQNKELTAAIVGGFIGVFGSVAILITGYYLKQLGKLTANTTNWKLSLLKSDNTGGLEYTDKISETERIEVSLSINLYNSSETPKNLENVHLEFKSKGSNEKFYLPLYNPSEQPSLFVLKKIDAITIYPRELLHLDLRANGSRKDIILIHGRVDVILKANYPNGRKFSRKLQTLG